MSLNRSKKSNCRGDEKALESEEIKSANKKEKTEFKVHVHVGERKP